jgi:hypothetical protein
MKILRSKAYQTTGQLFDQGQMYGFFLQTGMGYGVLEGYGLWAKIKHEPTSSRQKAMG